MPIELAILERRHAADELGVPPDVSATDAQAAFLRRLPAAGFLPAPALCAAAAMLTGRGVAGAVDAEPANAADLRAEAAAFAQSFWSVPPGERRLRWQILLRRTAGDPLMVGRVRSLEAGVDLADSADGAATVRQRQIVGMAQALFVLGPVARAARRRELLDGLPPPVQAWEAAAREVVRDYPAHAALEPALIERLSHWSGRLRPTARSVSQPAPTWGIQAQGGLHIPQAPRVVAPRRKSGFPVWIAIPFVLSLMRAAGGLMSPSRDTPQYTPSYRPQAAPSYQSPPIRPYKAPLLDFTPEQEKKLRRLWEQPSASTAPPKGSDLFNEKGRLKPEVIRNIRSPQPAPADRRPP
jgi:hypothetical protein